jgi:hypothetical protein
MKKLTSSSLLAGVSFSSMSSSSLSFSLSESFAFLLSRELRSFSDSDDESSFRLARFDFPRRDLTGRFSSSSDLLETKQIKHEYLHQ